MTAITGKSTKKSTEVKRSYQIVIDNKELQPYTLEGVIMTPHAWDSGVVGWMGLGKIVRGNLVCQMNVNTFIVGSANNPSVKVVCTETPRNKTK